MDSTITPAVNGEKPTAGAEKKPTKRPKRRPVSGNGTRQKRKAAADGGNGKPKNKGNRPSIKPASRKKIGRPSKYNPAFCERIIELGAEGKSKAQISAAIGVSRDTLREWGGIYPDFSAALKRAKELELAWWETVGQACMLRPGFNATAFILQMKNRFREDYRDVSHGEHRITQLTDVSVRVEVPDIASMMDKRDALAAFERFCLKLTQASRCQRFSPCNDYDPLRSLRCKPCAGRGRAPLFVADRCAG